MNSVIPIILNKLSIIKFDNIIIKSIDDIKKYDIDELVKLYNYLYKQYPEIFLAKIIFSVSVVASPVSIIEVLP